MESNTQLANDKKQMKNTREKKIKILQNTINEII